MTFRILVTGSRNWTELGPIRQGFEWALRSWGLVQREMVVVHGAQGTYDDNGRLVSGADMLADRVAKAMEIATDPHPARWNDPCKVTCRPNHRRVGKDGQEYCPAAGNYRNAEMVAAGADICLAFPLPGSIGTHDCIRRAKAAGIPTYVYGGGER